MHAQNFLTYTVGVEHSDCSAPIRDRLRMDQSEQGEGAQGGAARGNTKGVPGGTGGFQSGTSGAARGVSNPLAHHPPEPHHPVCTIPVAPPWQHPRPVPKLHLINQLINQSDFLVHFLSGRLTSGWVIMLEI